MLKGKVGALFLAALLNGCGGNGDRLPQQLKAIEHPPEIEVADIRTAGGILGRAEAVVSLKVNAAYRAQSIADHYKKQLKDSGWDVCSDQMLNAWAEILDATSGSQKTKSQLVMRFSRADFDGEILLEQDKPRDGGNAKDTTPGMGYLRITTPASLSCSAKK